MTAATLALLETTIERYGRDAVTDPVALESALRAATVAPPEPQIVALVDAAADGTVGRLRAALEDGADPGAGLDAAAGADPVARWATGTTAAALGLLPRALALALPPPVDAEAAGPVDRADTTVDVDRDRTADTAVVAAGADDRDTAASTPPPYRRRLLLLGASVVVVLGLVAVGVVALTRESTGRADPAPTTTAAALTAVTAPPTPTPTPTPSAAPPADPRAVFEDPGLLALAEPYLAEPGTFCQAEQPSVNVQEHVICAVPSGRVAGFTKTLSVDVMHDLRAGFLEGPYAEDGSVRSLRWKFVPGRPGVRTGIAPDRAEQGEGVRVRYVDDDGTPRLYFDQDSCPCTGFLALVEPTGDDRADLDALRAYWADPSR